MLVLVGANVHVHVHARTCILVAATYAHSTDMTYIAVVDVRLPLADVGRPEVGALDVELELTSLRLESLDLAGDLLLQFHDLRAAK